jgi:protein-S-isoprenylcysteine O-methyltransferase Ste14
MNPPAPTPDTPGVLAPPPLIALVTLAVGLVLDRLIPIGAAGAIVPRGWRLVVAALLFLISGCIAFRAIGTFRRAGTNFDVRKPALVLAVSGIYERTRNPMYQALALLLLGFAVGFASDWTVLLLAPWILVMHFAVVLPEERYLAARFGEDYRRYQARVPRYGWPL